MKQIYKVNNKISIWADRIQYIVRIAKVKKKKENEQKYENWYYPTISMCFEEIYELLLKEKLTEKIQKDLDSIKAIHSKSIKEIKRAIEDYCSGTQEL